MRSSFPRKRESRDFGRCPWTPAFVGVTSSCFRGHSCPILFRSAEPIKAAPGAQTMSHNDNSDCTVHFRSDGLALSPGEYSDLLVRIAADGGIAADEFSREGVVAELEDRMAALLGKETAIFLPSGTLANHLALRLLAKRGRRILVQRESHIYNDSGDCVQELSGLTLVPLAPERASFSLDDVESEVARAEDGRVSTPVGVISIETPVRRVRGEVFDFGEMQRTAAFARERRLGLHLDGARIFLASAYTGISPDNYAALFDT